VDRLAVIDLGSNTFHLLIVERSQTAPYFTEVYRERQFIYLSSGGIDNIDLLRQNDAVICMRNFKAKCEAFGCSQIRAVGTETLRSAENGSEMLERMTEETGIEIELITGSREADLIFRGTQCLGDNLKGRYLVMDIGGGSVEFIVGEQGKILYATSIKAGISVIRERFKLSEPLRSMEMHDVHNSIDGMVGDLADYFDDPSIEMLVGSSGSFEIVESINGDEPVPDGHVYDISNYRSIADRVLATDAEGRALIKGMPVYRADLSKESFIMMEYVMQRFGAIHSLLVSPYALKEGIIAEEFDL